MGTHRSRGSRLSAGESARDVARKNREKAARLNQRAERFERGAEGEAATAEVLTALPASWAVLHDVRWPGRKRANIDHVVIGPGGVFVIDSKNWSSDIVITDDGLKAGGRSKRDTIEAAWAAAGEIAALIPPSARVHTVPAICFVRDEPLGGRVEGVMICSTQNLAEMLTSRPPMLGVSESQEVVAMLTQGLEAAARAARRPRSSASRTKASTSSQKIKIASSSTRRKLRERAFELAVGLVAVGVLFYVGNHILDFMPSQPAPPHTVLDRGGKDRKPCAHLAGKQRHHCLHKANSESN